MAKARFQGLDGMRGACALTVVLYHCELLFKPGVIFCHGYLAVDMFFLLSGFVISASYDDRLAQGMGVQRFLGMRLKRLAPVYWAGTALCVAGGLLAGLYLTAPTSWTVLRQGLMAGLLIPQFAPRTFAYPTNPVAWTLGWELLVNTAYAAWLRGLANRPLALLVALFMLAAFAEALVNPRGWSFGMTGTDVALGGLRCFPEFLGGVLLFRAFRAGRLDRLPAVTPILPVMAWGLCATQRPRAAALVGCHRVMLACRPSLAALLVRQLAGPVPPWLVWLGALSYPLYACHLAFVTLARTTALVRAEPPSRSPAGRAGGAVGAGRGLGHPPAGGTGRQAQRGRSSPARCSPRAIFRLSSGPKPLA